MKSTVLILAVIMLFSIVTCSLLLADPLSGIVYITESTQGGSLRTVGFSYDGTSLNLEPAVTLAQFQGGVALVAHPLDDEILFVDSARDVILVDKDSGMEIERISGGRSIGRLEILPAFGGDILLSTTNPTSSFQINLDGSLENGNSLSIIGDVGTTQIIATPTGDAFYTTGTGTSPGWYGKITFESPTVARTERWYGSNGILSNNPLPAAHGGVYDPFTDTIILTGTTFITQLDLTGTLLSERDFARTLEGNENPTFFQGSVDGNGHLFVSSLTGHLLFIDYSGTGEVGSTNNFATLTPVMVEDPQDGLRIIEGLNDVELFQSGPTSVQSYEKLLSTWGKMKQDHIEGRH